ncbi:Translation initiation factor 3 subunit J component [Dimargaris xerosporica]|nr:Translation initiation factor 3 subunit J component [Dimargaris xerosporica]
MLLGTGQGSEPAPILFRKKRFEDEESDDDDIKDAWDETTSEEESEEEDEASEEEEVAPIAPKPVAKPQPKAAPAVSEAQAKRDELRSLELNADEQNAADLFAGMSIKDEKFKEDFLTLNPRNKDDFDVFRKVLVERVASFKNQRAYATFITELVRDLCDPLKDVDVRKCASSLTSLANEKQKAAKDAVKGKKKKKKAAMVSTAPAKASLLDMNNDYGDDYGDYDDFM